MGKPNIGLFDDDIDSNPTWKCIIEWYVTTGCMMQLKRMHIEK